MKSRACFIVLIFVGLAFANINLIQPKNMLFDQVITVSDETGKPNVLRGAELGDIAPGQTLAMVFSTTSGGNFDWTQSVIVPPQGWEKEDAVALERDVHTLTSYLYVPANAAEGTYSFDVQLSRGLEGIRTPEKVTMTLNVKNSVFDYGFPAQYAAAAGKSALQFTVKSNSIGSDVLKILSLGGLPEKYTIQENAEIGPLEQKTVSLDVIPLDENIYTVTFNIGRESSGIVDTVDKELRIKPTIQSKLMLFGDGFSLVPVILQPFYSLLSIFGLL